MLHSARRKKKESYLTSLPDSPLVSDGSPAPYYIYATLGEKSKKNEVSEVFDAKRAPLVVLVISCATETPFIDYNLPIASTNLKLLT